MGACDAGSHLAELVEMPLRVSRLLRARAHQDGKRSDERMTPGGVCTTSPGAPGVSRAGNVTTSFGHGGCVFTHPQALWHNHLRKVFEISLQMNLPPPGLVFAAVDR